MAATLKTDRLQNKTDTTDNIFLNSSGATTFGGAVDINSGAIDGTTVGAASASTGAFTNVTATNIQATSGQPLSIKEDTGTTVITVEADGDVVIDPGTTLTLGDSSDNTISGTPSGAGEDRHSGQTIELQAKVTGVGYQSGLESSSAAKAVGVMYAGITGEVKMYGGQYAPEGWVLCDGARYDGTAGTAYKNLYDVIGQNYGDGDSSDHDFNVPDLRGRVPMGVGTGQGLNTTRSSSGQDPATGSGSTLTARNRGAYGGVETHLLTATQSGVKAHGHDNNITVSSGTVTVNAPTFSRASWASGYELHELGSLPYTRDSPASGTMTPGGFSQTATLASLATTGAVSTAVAESAGAAHPNEMPYMCLNFIIKL
jgi:microcystin-dependent protein